MCDNGRYASIGVVYVNGQVVSISRCTECGEHIGEPIDLDEVRIVDTRPEPTQESQSVDETTQSEQDESYDPDDFDGVIG